MKISIVIQGPTNYCRDILPISKKYSVIWSTWKDEPKENIDYIVENCKEGAILNKKPKSSGHLNINMQTASTLSGIEGCDGDYIFKTRGDMLWKGLDELIEKIIENNESKLSFLAYQVDQIIPYMADFFAFGTKKQMMDFWDYRQAIEDSRCPEVQLLQNYSLKHNIDDGLKSFYYFLPLLEKDKIDCYWLKYPEYSNGVLKSFADWKNVPYIKS